jgi:hypothetical protein
MLKLIATLLALALVPNPGARSQGAWKSPVSQITGSAPSLRVERRVVHLGFEADESMIVEAPGGTLVVAAQGGPWSSDSQYAANPAYWNSQWRARLWTSRDHGATWKQAILGPADGDIGNSDVDLAAAPDGTLYLASMKWNESAREGLGMAVGVSDDVGATWSWTKLSTRRFADRPWTVVAPDGTAHVIWNDGQGVQHVASRDGGKTWSRPARIYDHAGSSHLAVGPHGELAVRLIPWSASHNFLKPSADLIAVSTDAGAHWKTWRAPGERQWGTWAAAAAHAIRSDGVEEFAGKDTAILRCCSAYDIPRWIEPLAWDGEGRLYSLWTDRTGVWLARSMSGGATWTSWRIVDCGAPCFFPYLIGRRDGELAATWHVGNAINVAGTVAKGEPLRWQAAVIKVGHGTSAPRVVKSQLIELETFNWGDGTHSSGVDRQPAGEYLPVTFLRQGGIGVATPIQDPRAHRVGFTYWRFVPR